MNYSDPTAGGLPTPPLPTQPPPPLPTSASMPNTSSPTSTTIQGVDRSDPFSDDSTARLINFNDPYSTPMLNRTTGQSMLWSTPAYHPVQSVFQSTPTGSQWYGNGFQSASPHLPMSTLAVSPAIYIAAGLPASQDSLSQASSVTSVRTLCSDAFGQPFHDLSKAATHRKAELQHAFASCGLTWPFIPVDPATADLRACEEGMHMKSDRIRRQEEGMRLRISARVARRGMWQQKLDTILLQRSCAHVKKGCTCRALEFDDSEGMRLPQRTSARVARRGMRQQKPDTHAAEYAAPEGIISRANQR